MNSPLDAIVIGSGPNGLSAAIALARAGKSVRVYEAEPTIGGATKSLELTLPGFTHDLGAAVHSLVQLSPFLRVLPLEQHGLTLIAPSAPFAHPLDDAPAVVVERSVEQTSQQFPAADARAYRSLVQPWVSEAPLLMEALLAPFGFKHPLVMARFGRHAIRSIEGLAHGRFSSEPLRAMLAGVGAHSMLPLENLSTAGYTLGLLVAAHAGGWPVARGGSQQLSTAMSSYLRSLGGEIIVDHTVTSLAELPPARAVLCDLTPRQFANISAKPNELRRNGRGAAWRLSHHRHGPGVFKLDWALREPVPWRDAGCRRAGTIHLGGTFEEIAGAERDVWEGHASVKPYVLLVQPTICDPSRAPAGGHTLWAYCHVPNASTEDMSVRIENQIERFAPGFREVVLQRHELFPADLERHDANLVGGDIAGGAANFAQQLWRSAALDPYCTPIANVYLCSSSTPPGVGVHGMSGFHAAQSALQFSLA